MTIDTVLTEWAHLPAERKIKALESLVGELKNDPESYDDVILSLLQTAESFDVDDAFGTEGLNV